MGGLGEAFYNTSDRNTSTVYNEIDLVESLRWSAGWSKMEPCASRERAWGRRGILGQPGLPGHQLPVVPPAGAPTLGPGLRDPNHGENRAWRSSHLREAGLVGLARPLANRWFRSCHMGTQSDWAAASHGSHAASGAPDHSCRCRTLSPERMLSMPFGR